MFTSFCSKLIKETIYQILSISPKLLQKILQKKHFGLFFPDTVQFEIASLGPRNDRSGADIDILGPPERFFRFRWGPGTGATQIHFAIHFHQPNLHRSVIASESQCTLWISSKWTFQALVCLSVYPSVCLSQSVTLDPHLNTSTYRIVFCNVYDRAMLDAHSFCGS